MTNKTKPPKSTREALLRDIEAFLVANPDISDTQFGWRAVQNTQIVERLRSGKDITTRHLDSIVLFMRRHKNSPAS